MRNIKKLAAAALIGIMSLSAVGCSMIEKTPMAIKNATVAKVGNTTITKGQVDERLKPLIESLKEQYGENYAKDETAKEYLQAEAKKTLDNMVSEEILLQKAKEKKLVPDSAQLDEEAATEIAKVKKENFGDDQAKFDEAVKAAGFTSDTLKKYFRDQIVINKVIEDMLKEVNVEDKDVSAYYEANKAQYTQNPGARMAHILLDTEDKAKEVKARIDKGEKFEALAKEFNTDATKETGGDLGFVAYDEPNFDKDFLEGSKKLKENEVSGPVKSQFGYHLIKVTGIKTEPVVKSLDEVKEEIKLSLEDSQKQTKYTSTMEAWKKELNVKINEKNL